MSTTAAAKWDQIWTGRRWWDFRYRKFKYGHLTAWERELFLELAQRVPEGGSVLSVGCGRALIDYWLAAALGIDVHLLDLSEPLIKKVRRSFGPVANRTYHHDALDLPFPDETFDAVWNEGVWEHFPEESIALGIGEMARVSKRYVLVDVPNAECRPYMLAKEWLEEHNLWTYGFEQPKSSLRQFFESANLDVVDEHPIGSRQTCVNYLNMINDEEAREEITSRLEPQDYEVYPHILTIGKRKGS